jgi:hypothetical protein
MLQRVTELTAVKKHEKTINILFFSLYFVMAFSEEQHQMSPFLEGTELNVVTWTFVAILYVSAYKDKTLQETGLQLCVMLK